MRKDTSTKSIASLVKEALEHDLYVRELLSEGIITFSALARRLLPWVRQFHPNASAEAIVIAIQRYARDLGSEQYSEAARKIIASSQVSTRNDVAHFTFARDAHILKDLLKASQRVRWDQEEIFLLNQGSGEITVIVDEHNARLLSELRAADELRGLAIVSIKETHADGVPSSMSVPGVYAHFITLLARRSINIVEIISTSSQLTLVVKGADLLRSYQAVQESVAYLRAKKPARVQR